MITELIRKRRSIFPPMYNDKVISKQTIEEILENANWAPTHKLTEPWRFQVFQGQGLEKLSEFLSSKYKKVTPEESFSEAKFNKIKKKPLKAGAVIAIVMHRDPEERIPEWEEIAAVACAVQNMWLTCTEKGIGSYWGSPSFVTNEQTFFDLKENERCLGLFFMGYSDMMDIPGKRTPITGKTTWRS